MSGLGINRQAFSHCKGLVTETFRSKATYNFMVTAPFNYIIYARGCIQLYWTVYHTLYSHSHVFISLKPITNSGSQCWCWLSRVVGLGLMPVFQLLLNGVHLVLSSRKGKDWFADYFSSKLY